MAICHCRPSKEERGEIGGRGASEMGQIKGKMIKISRSHMVLVPTFEITDSSCHPYYNIDHRKGIRLQLKPVASGQWPVPYQFGSSTYDCSSKKVKV